MKQLHDAEDTDSDGATADSNKNSRSSANSLDGNDKDNCTRNVKENGNKDTSMTDKPANERGGNIFGDMQVDEIFAEVQADATDTTNEVIQLEESDEDDAVDHASTGNEYSDTRLSGSPRQKKTPLSDKVKLLGSTSQDILDTNKKVKEHHTQLAPYNTAIEGLDGRESD